MPYPINTPSHNQITSNNFNKNAPTLAQAKKKNASLTAGKVEQIAYSTVNYSQMPNNAQCILEKGITHVANNHQYGQAMTRYMAHDLDMVNKPSKSRLTAEVLIQSLKERRHTAEHPEVLQHVISALNSKNPQQFNALLNNPGFLHMCLNDNRILPNFRAVIYANIHEGNLHSASSNDQEAVKNLQKFCAMSHAELSNMLQQGSKRFDQHMSAKMNKASAISAGSHVVKAGVGAIPYAGPVLVGLATGVQIAEVVHNHNHTVNQLGNAQYHAVLGGAATSGIVSGVTQEAITQGALSAGKQLGSEAAAGTAEFALGTVLPGVNAAARLAIGLPSTATARYGAAKFYHDNKFNMSE